MNRNVTTGRWQAKKRKEGQRQKVDRKRLAKISKDGERQKVEGRQRNAKKAKVEGCIGRKKKEERKSMEGDRKERIGQETNEKI